jgi:hypothetical protein
MFWRAKKAKQDKFMVADKVRVALKEASKPITTLLWDGEKCYEIQQPGCYAPGKFL